MRLMTQQGTKQHPHTHDVHTTIAVYPTPHTKHSPAPTHTCTWTVATQRGRQHTHPYAPEGTTGPPWATHISYYLSAALHTAAPLNRSLCRFGAQGTVQHSPAQSCSCSLPSRELAAAAAPSCFWLVPAWWPLELLVPTAAAAATAAASALAAALGAASAPL